MEGSKYLIEQQAGEVASALSVAVFATTTEICIPELEKSVGEVPRAVEWSLLLEPLCFGVWYLTRHARQLYKGEDAETFITEFNRQLLFYIVWLWAEPKTVGFAPASSPWRLREEEGQTKMMNNPLSEEQKQLKDIYLYLLDIRQRQHHEIRHSFAGFRSWFFLTLADLLAADVTLKGFWMPPGVRMDKVFLEQLLIKDFADNNFKAPKPFLERAVQHYLIKIYEIGRDTRVHEYRRRAA